MITLSVTKPVCSIVKHNLCVFWYDHPVLLFYIYRLNVCFLIFWQLKYDFISIFFLHHLSSREFVSFGTLQLFYILVFAKQVG